MARRPSPCLFACLVVCMLVWLVGWSVGWLVGRWVYICTLFLGVITACDLGMQHPDVCAPWIGICSRQVTAMNWLWATMVTEPLLNHYEPLLSTIRHSWSPILINQPTLYCDCTPIGHGEPLLISFNASLATIMPSHHYSLLYIWFAIIYSYKTVIIHTIITISLSLTHD